MSKLLIVLGAILSSMIINAFTFPYAINYWLVYLHKEPVIQWWQGVLVGLVPGIGQISIPFAVITWLLSLFL